MCGVARRLSPDPTSKKYFVASGALFARTLVRLLLSPMRGTNMKNPRPSLKYVSVKELDRSKMSFENFTVEDPAVEKLGKLEGFIIDVDKAIPYYVVVNAGSWFRSKH